MLHPNNGIEAPIPTLNGIIGSGISSSRGVIAIPKGMLK